MERAMGIDPTSETRKKSVRPFECRCR
jgi:hypothetical protein